MKFLMRTMIVLACLTAFLILSPPPGAQAATCTWNGSDGNWNNAAKWSCGVAPGEDDDAIIPGGTVTLTEDVTVTSLTLTGGYLTGAGSLTAGTINWSAGTMSGSGSTTATTALSFTGFSNITLNGRTFHNAGAATWNRTGAGFLYLQNALAVFNNLAGATFTIQSSGTNVVSGAGTFHNAGTLTKSSPGDTVQVGAVLVNAGTGVIEVESGTLVISNGAGAAASGGGYNIHPGATLHLTGQAYNLTGDIVGTGSGTIEAAATVNLDGTLAFSGALSLVSGGTLTLSTDDTTADVGVLNLALGSLTGPGDLTADTINWSAGTMSGSGSTTATSAANFTGSGNITLNGRTFNNAGTATWNRTGAGFLYFQNAASVFNNQAGAAFTVESSGTDITSGNGVFNNAGTLNLTTGQFGIATFRQQAGGVTNLAIGGETPFTDYCRLVTGIVELAGRLNVSFTGGYAPQVGDHFVLLSYATTRTGDYAPVVIEPVSGIVWEWFYYSGDLNLWAMKDRIYLPLVVR